MNVTACKSVPAITKLIAVAAVGLWAMVLMCSGCTNAPGAARMRLAPEKQVFYRDEAISLEGAIIAGDAPVCLVREYHYKVEIQPESGGARIQGSDGHPWIDGTGLMAMLPILPIYLGVAYLDAADAWGRFVVIPKGRGITFHLSIHPANDWLWVSTDRACKKDEKVRQPFAPGRYAVRVSLWNQNDDPFPPPLFWKPYDQPVVGETQVVIVDRPTTSNVTTRAK
jgi:hypothetical protein